MQLPPIEFWYEALSERFGTKVLVTEGSREAARQRLYKARADALASDPEATVLKSLALVLPPPPADQREVWVLKARPTNVPTS